MKVCITKEILKRTAKCDIRTDENNPISEAIRHMFPAVQTGLASIYPFGAADGRCIPMPLSMAQYIYKWDLASPSERMDFPEIEFDVMLPEQIIQHVAPKALAQ